MNSRGAHLERRCQIGQATTFGKAPRRAVLDTCRHIGAGPKEQLNHVWWQRVKGGTTWLAVEPRTSATINQRARTRAVVVNGQEKRGGAAGVADLHISTKVQQGLQRFRRTTRRRQAHRRIELTGLCLGICRRGCERGGGACEGVGRQANWCGNNNTSPVCLQNTHL